MKDWAIEKGATHYAHVFFPLTGATAEKHDSFLSPNAINVAANLTVEILKTIFPAAVRYQNELASTGANLKLLGCEIDTDTLDRAS